MFLPSLRYKYSQLVTLASRQFHLGSAVLGRAGYEEVGYDKVKISLHLSIHPSS